MEEHASSPQGRGRFIVGHGPRHTEALLLADLDVLLDEAENDPSRLSPPVILVVSSNSLRDHLASRIVRRRGRSVAGLRVVTLFGLARDVLRRAGVDVTPATLSFEVLARRAARREEVLSNALGDLDDGFASVVGSIRDLLDAGLTEAHRTAVEERLEELGTRAGRSIRAARTRGLVRAAARVDDELTRLHGLRPGAVYASAAELLTASAGALLPARDVLIHGFADATGVASALLGALVGHCGARMVVDRPPDPADPGRVDAGAAFSERTLASLGWTPLRAETGVGAPPVIVKLFRAPGAHAEVREVAHRVRALLAGDVSPEHIGVVARDLSPYVVPLRTALGRLAVPFSGVDVVAPPGPTWRRLRAVAGLLEEGGATATDLWLDATVDLDPGEGEVSPDTSLRLALRALGASQVADVAALDLDAAGVGRAFRLPIRGPADDETGGGNDGRLHRRTVHRELLEKARNAARTLVVAFDLWPASASARAHVQRLAELLIVHLGWRDEAVGDQPAFAAVRSLAAGLSDELALTREELALMVRRTLEVRAVEPLGGAGGGVQVMTVTAARARTFEHLFVLGLNRDRFPRQVAEDPLLPDAIRRALRDVLPDLPLKGDGHAEDRFLFAQLLGAAPNVTLSWLSADDDGAEQPPSPLVERLRLAAVVVEAPTEAPALLGPPPPDTGPLPAHERALHTALHGEHGAFPGILELAGREAGWEHGAAAARVAALLEADGVHHGATLGPTFGFIGAQPAGGVWVTTLERMAGCPWRAFLEGELGIEPPPDPLAAPAGIAAPLVGTLVHAVLQAVVSGAVGRARPLADLVSGEAATMAPPAPEDLRRRLGEQALRLAHAEGVPHLATALAARAEPFVRLACRLLWADGPLAALGAEVVGEATTSGPDGPVAVPFRADLVERRADLVVLTDFKTGRPLSRATTPSKRDEHLRQAVAQGDALQAAAYARAAGPGAIGRYLYLKDPEGELPAREFAVRGDDGVLETLDRTLTVLLAARAAGVRFPRLLKPDLEESFEGCRTCEVAQACLQPDSGARRRLARWVERMRGGSTAHGAEAAAFATWRLRDRDRETP